MRFGPIEIEETAGIPRFNEPITVGVPFPHGTLKQLGTLSLTDSEGRNLPLQVKETASWPDGSVRWALLDFQVSLGDGEISQLGLRSDTALAAPQTFIEIQETEKQIQVDTGKAVFIVNKQIFEPIEKVLVNGKETLQNGQSKIVLADHKNDSYRPVIQAIAVDDATKKIRTTLHVNGVFRSERGKEFADFFASMTFYAAHSLVKLDFTIGNSRAAKHPGGLWDLGDPGSIFFEELFIRFALSNPGDFWWKKEGAALSRKEKTDTFSIYQDSSGGENWRGNNHKNRFGKITHQYRGYRCHKNGEEIERGDRLSPVVYMEHKGGTIGVHIKQFWQNFPKAISVEKGQLALQLFPRSFAHDWELQGGERKTHTLYLDFDAAKKSLDWVQRPLVAKLPFDWYQSANCFPYLTVIPEGEKYDSLIGAGIEGKNNFFQKREVVDEYGWRNFGELYADHETLGYQGDQALVSHYNNQYDPLYGFTRQFVLTGDLLWFELMEDLARHISDIDIYHSIDDREEFNGGLFWHTNHYLDASTCTHRTFSKNHPDITADGPSGGGPGSEHCYTSGLLYHYYLTGSEPSRESVLTLAEWLSALHSMPDTILGRLQVLRNKGLPLFKKVLKGERVARYKYPLTRGTGNYINTLMDAYLLRRDSEYIVRVERIIEQTIHPNDNVQYRSLDNVEANWSYTVFLQAVVKYLDLKEWLGEQDSPYRYARDALLSYASWMLIHETPYLNKPETLDYPNPTVDSPVAIFALGTLAEDYVNAHILPPLQSGLNGRLRRNIMKVAKHHPSVGGIIVVARTL